MKIKNWLAVGVKLFEKPLVKLGFSFILLWFVFRQVNLNDVLLVVRQISWESLVLYVILFTTLLFLSAWRWSYILFNHPDVNHYKACLRATWVGVFYNLVMPSVIGGDVVKWTSLAHFGLSRKKMLFSVFVDRFVGMVGLVMAGLLAVIGAHFFNFINLPNIFKVAVLLISLGVVLVWVMIFFADRLNALPLTQKIPYFPQLSYYAHTHRVALLKGLAISLVIQTISNTALFILATGVGFNLSLIIFFVLEPIISLITTIPISFAGLGTTEAANIYFFSQMGVPVTIILAMTTLLTIFRFGYGLVGWIVMVWSSRK